MAPGDGDVADPSLAPAGAEAIDRSAREMPVLAALTADFARSHPLAGQTVACCLHVTPETGVFVRALQAAGAGVRLAAANPMATRDDVAAACFAGGMAVFARHGADPAAYSQHLDDALRGEPTLLADDGCDLVARLLAGEAGAGAGRLRGGVEETATGVLRLRQLAARGALPFPMVAVNETPTSRLVSTVHGTGQSVVEALLRSTDLLLAGRSVVVAGYGAAGAGVAQRLRGLGSRVVVAEVHARAGLAAALDGFAVMPLAEALPHAELVVSATGNRNVVSAAQLGLLRDGVVLANAGHFDVEIDVAAVVEAAVEVKAAGSALQEYLLPDGRRVRVVAEGRVANLAVAGGHPPAAMDVDFAAQLLALVWLAGDGAPAGSGVLDLPGELDQRVAALALQALGGRLDQLTAEQREYLRAWR